MIAKSCVKPLLPLIVCLAIGFMTGCATTAPIDWNSRVGHYTYAEAVQEFGPPNRQIQLSSGSSEYRWIARTSPVNPGFHAGGMDNNGMNGVNNGFGMGHGPGINDRYLQLTFDTHGVLTAWSKNY